jgi:hypothetical protein
MQEISQVQPEQVTKATVLPLTASKDEHRAIDHTGGMETTRLRAEAGVCKLDLFPGEGLQVVHPQIS